VKRRRGRRRAREIAILEWVRVERGGEGRLRRLGFFRECRVANEKVTSVNL
jgi:hypothetical protein